MRTEPDSVRLRLAAAFGPELVALALAIVLVIIVLIVTVEFSSGGGAQQTPGRSLLPGTSAPASPVTRTL